MNKTLKTHLETSIFIIIVIIAVLCITKGVDWVYNNITITEKQKTLIIFIIFFIFMYCYIYSKFRKEGGEQ